MITVFNISFRDTSKPIKIANISLKNLSMAITALLLLAINPYLSTAHASTADDDISESVYMYRYQTESGGKTVGFQVPPESIKFGYEMLDKRLRTIRVVDPAPSDEALAAIKQKRMDKLEAERLLQTFSSSEDAERARNRKIGALDVIIKITTGNIHRLNIEYETLASQAAHIEKRGGTISDELKLNMKSITRQITDANHFISEKKTEIEGIYKDYGGDIERLKEIETRSAK